MPQQIEALAALDRGSLAGAYIDFLTGEIRRVREYDVAQADICFFGKTGNNLKEFKFLQKILDEQGVQYTCCYFLDDFECTKRKLSGLSKPLLDSVHRDTERWLQSVASITGAQLFRHLQYTGAYLNVMYSYSGKDYLLPRIAVVANDHAPLQVGFAMAMETLGVPVIYMQHAEVSGAFPPLDFTAAVLRNQVSLDRYRNAGRVKGRVFVVSRNFDGGSFQKVPEKLIDQAIVGIYPTSHCDPAAIRRAIDSLGRNPAVADYFVKPHPNSATVFTDEDARHFRVRSAAPDEDHVAIVGNSSVVVDLLGRGHPVYQLFELDRIEPDYYGFVKLGLVPAIAPAALAQKFWDDGFYRQEWLQRVSQYEPSIRENQVLARRRLAGFLRRRLVRRKWTKVYWRVVNRLKSGEFLEFQRRGRRWGGIKR
ncbi:hypothetical protein [Microvirga sp. M2]|uniref:hypothetical protein n=1 Tax=Microvirga sp. M2 TaxID=3073270 RepID=UPI0039C1AC4E